ncbi:UNVERIFIED_ORG: hypothetical protein ABIB13_000260 [Arthrobacter sp. UYEF2]
MTGYCHFGPGWDNDGCPEGHCAKRQNLSVGYFTSQATPLYPHIPVDPKAVTAQIDGEWIGYLPSLRCHRPSVAGQNVLAGEGAALQRR